jgi:Flp pilus assembly pilin Flp
MRNILRRLKGDDNGAAMAEYALILGVVAAGGVVAFTLLGTNITGVINFVAGKIVT